MGNEQTKKTDIIDINLPHPKFLNSKLVKAANNVHLQTNIACDEKEFEKWMKRIEDVKL